MAKISQREIEYAERLKKFATPPGEAAVQLCAIRMERTLNSRPRHPKTRAYVETLPKRKAPARVSTEEFARCRAVAVKQIAEKLVLAAAVPPPHPSERKDRLRPRVRAIRDLETCRQHRLALHAAQDGECGYCGEPIAVALKGSLDHVIPLFHHGPDELHNLLLMHGECNGKKSNHMPNEFVLERNRAKNERLGLPQP